MDSKTKRRAKAEALKDKAQTKADEALLKCRAKVAERIKKAEVQMTKCEAKADERKKKAEEKFTKKLEEVKQPPRPKTAKPKAPKAQAPKAAGNADALLQKLNSAIPEQARMD